MAIFGLARLSLKRPVVGGCLAAIVVAFHSAPLLAQPTLATDLGEEIVQMQATASDLYGRRESRQIPLTMFRPSGPGPFHLVVVAHGRNVEERLKRRRERYEQLARFLVSRGFVVLVPTRLGYGDTADFDPEYAGGCNTMQLDAPMDAAADQVQQAVDYARTLPYVDATRWVVMGQSVGGVAVAAVLQRNPAGLVGGVNFSGGYGRTMDPGRPCAPHRVESYFKGAGSRAKLPMLWLYWENDQSWGAAYPKQWHRAWLKGGGSGEFLMLPPTGRNGHYGLDLAPWDWEPQVATFLEALGFGAR